MEQLSQMRLALLVGRRAVRCCAWRRMASSRSVYGYVSASSIEALAADYEADELVVVTITHDPKARRRSYELLAKVFGLEEAPS